MNVEPQVFLIGETQINHEGLQNLLDFLGVPDWKSDAPSDIEKLVEVYGRACYMSFQSETHKASELNPNLTQVRKHNKDYIDNVIDKGDGSILEHGFVNFFFGNVSRVLTAELCRHRVGVAISEMSLRFVRLTNLNWYAPTVIKEDENLITIYAKTFEELSNLQKQIAEIIELDKEKSFDKKKQITSAMRRVAPLGLATNIGWSTNIRNLRHVIEMRTSIYAEEEIRILFDKVALIAEKKWPNLFSDYIRNENGEWITNNKKV